MKPRKKKVLNPVKRTSGTHPLKAAFYCGQLLNQIDWHMQQAWLLYRACPADAKKHYDWSRGCLSELGLAARACSKSAVSEKMTNDVTAIGQQWIASWDSRCHKADLDEAEEAMSRHDELNDDRADFQMIRIDLCKKALSEPRGLVAELTSLLESRLTEQAVKALHLGVCVDRGARIGEVCRFVWKPPSSKTLGPPPSPHKNWVSYSLSQTPTELDADKSQSPSELDADISQSELPPKLDTDPTRLANVSCSPYEFGPENGWHEELRHRCEEIGIAEQIDFSFAEMGGKPDLERSMPDFVSQLEQALARLDGPKHGSKPDDERNKFIYDEMCKGTKYETIRKKVNAHTGWKKLGSVQGVTKEGERYAKDFGLPMPPARTKRWPIQ